MTRVKICGIRTPSDALAAVDAGADAVGLVLTESPREVDLDEAEAVVSVLPPMVSAIGVFMNQDVEHAQQTAIVLRLGAVQLHGEEAPDDCNEAWSVPVIKRFRVEDGDSTASLAERMRPYRVAAYLLDPGAGSGRTFPWGAARGLPQRIIVSGGLTPENVGEAIRMLRPYAVDVSSGVERSAGVKDHDRMREFVRAVRAADADHGTR